MRTRTHCSLLASTLAALATASLALGDIVETKDGSRLVGTVVKIEGDKVILKTAYAGEVAIDQSAVANLVVEKPLMVRLDSGTVAQGQLSGTADAVVISSAEGSITTPVDTIAITWAPGATDPAVAALQRKWAYEVTADISGKTGNSEQLGTAVGARATLTSSQDKLLFYTAYNRQESDGVKSSDQFKLGLDYSNNFSGKYSWYARDEGGFDRVKDIELYNIAAVGLGYDFIKNSPKQILTGRLGLAFRYEGYRNPASDDVKSAGLDVGLQHEYSFDGLRMVNSLSYVPAFDDFADFRFIHDSFFEMPIAASRWKLRIGVSNDYTSEPPAGTDELDTTYYTRFVLSWD